ncbi:hypothetical protein L6452_18029 [Arctium lappa]|uniref:Uncharacterized protein n=1 Tax=Arctium lappa TaxID=4217 RepID=A0ACB9C561_ARCLA|nr:hypothetical protein L6452_18029 [Arctium lappa]
MTVLLVSSVKGTWMPKLDYLMGLGFEYEEVANMVLRSPGLLTFSIENNFKPKADFFLNDMKGDLGDLNKFPHYFSYGLEGKIKRRHWLLVDQGFLYHCGKCSRLVMDTMNRTQTLPDANGTSNDSSSS